MGLVTGFGRSAAMRFQPSPPLSLRPRLGRFGPEADSGPERLAPGLLSVRTDWIRLFALDDVSIVESLGKI